MTLEGLPKEAAAVALHTKPAEDEGRVVSSQAVLVSELLAVGLSKTCRSKGRKAQC